MEISNFTTNDSRTGHSLKRSQTKYEFDDCQITFEDGNKITVEGIICFSFKWKDTSFNHGHGVEKDGYWFPNITVAIVSVIYDRLGEVITLTKDQLTAVEELIEGEIENQEVENY